MKKSLYSSVSVLLILYFRIQLAASTSISSRLSSLICHQREIYFQTGVLQPLAISRPTRPDVPCGWFDLKNGRGQAATYKTCAEVQLPYSSGYNGKPFPRIVGGTEAEPHEFPSIVYMGGCGGTILDPQWILTAAHCLTGQSNNSIYKLEVTAGGHDKSQKEPSRQPRGIKKYFVHPKNRPESDYEYDIALIKVSEPFDLNEKVQPAQLPDESQKSQPQGEVIAAGWGIRCTNPFDPGCIASDVLLKVGLPYVSDDDCAKRLGPPDYQHYIPESVICAGGLPEGGKDACTGDSGGPLYKIKDGVQIVVGITSWGEECALPMLPGVWTEVAYYLQWIEETMAMN